MFEVLSELFPSDGEADSLSFFPGRLCAGEAGITFFLSEEPYRRTSLFLSSEGL